MSSRIRHGVLAMASVAMASCTGPPSGPDRSAPSPVSIELRPTTLELDDGASAPVDVILRDARGREIPVPVAAPAWASADPGIASVDVAGLVTANHPGTTAVTVLSGRLRAVAQVIVRPVPTRIEAVAGVLGEGTVGTAVPIPLAIRITDRHGLPVPGVDVQFQSTEGGSFAPSSAQANANGIATSVWTLGETAGSQRAQATVAGLLPVEFAIHAVAGAAHRLRLRTEPAGAQVGASLATQPDVAIEDRFGNVVESGTTSVTVQIGAGSGTVRGTTTLAAVNGVAQFEDLEIEGPVGLKQLRFSAAPLEPTSSTEFLLSPPPRSETDRPDDFIGPQVHVVYVLPSDGTDRELDITTALAYSIASFQRWLASQSGGLAVRMDTYRGALDITFMRLSGTNAELAPLDQWINYELESQLTTAGRISPDKRYLIYYDGGSVTVCGGAAWPPYVPGRVAAMYLRGISGTCANEFASSPLAAPRYWEAAALHDLFHVLGAVSPAAPHYQITHPAHVPESQDLMYAGTGSWSIGSLVLDVGGDDYFGSSVPPGIGSLATSPFLRPLPAGELQALTSGIRVGPPLDLSETSLPPHAPYNWIPIRLNH